MPLDILTAAPGKKIDRATWMAQQEAKAPRRLPARTRVQLKNSTLWAKRNVRLAIREAALRRVKIVMTYVKTTTGERKRYEVEAYESKYRRLRAGWRKVFYGYDVDDRTIKSFVIRAIQNVAITDRKYRPRWPVKFATWLLAALIVL